MAPPDWTVPHGHSDFLALKNPEVLKPETYATLLKQYFDDYFGRNEKLRIEVQDLVAQDFPVRNELEAAKVEHSGPQGNVKPFTIIDDPAAWTAASWEGREAEYTYYITEEDVAEIDAAVQSLKARGLCTEDDIKALKKEDFVLPKLGPKLVELGKDVSHGRGFTFIKGFPVQKYKEDRWGLIAAYWGVGLQLGHALVNQTDYNQETGQIEGSILNHIVYKGFRGVEGLAKNKQGHSGQHLPFHADQGATDLISLLCLSSAVEGGESKWVSSIAIHNELLRRGRKDLVEVLSKPFKLPKMVTQVLPYRNPEGHYEYEEIIPFEYHDGYLSIYFQSLTYYSVEREGGKLTPLQEEAIKAVIALAERPEFHFTHTLQPGDIEIIHNPSIFHSREAYTDGEADDQKRHLVRWWIHSDANKRPIAPSYAPRSSIAEGGGFKVPPGSNLRLPVYPIGHDKAKDYVKAA